MSINIVPIPAFNDNYLWLAVDNDSRQAFVVDPGDHRPVLDYLQANELQLTAILLTHHHPDHTGGVEQLNDRFHCAVYGPGTERFPQVTRPLQEGDALEVLGCRFRVISTPGHTVDHICYFSDDPGLGTKPVLFSGDTLFAGGCGRLFEGSAAQMLSSLDKLANLPAATQIYCAHEYTLSNLAFAAAVEPQNSDLKARIEQATALRHNHQPTLPSTIATELATNPFLRSSQPAVIDAACDHTGRNQDKPDQVFAAIRAWKDNF